MNRGYYAIIPASIRYDKEIPPNAKLLYGEITALCNEKGYCWATNSYFSELYGVSKVSISKWISKLTEKGYITSDIQYKEGTKEILNRYLRIVNVPIKEKFNTPIKEKFKDNNTSFNTTSNNTFNKKDDGDPIIDLLIKNQIVHPAEIKQTLVDDLNDVELFFGFDNPQEMILEAIKDSARGNGQTWKFVYNKLNLWRKQGFKNKQDLEKSLNKRQPIKKKSLFEQGEESKKRFAEQAKNQKEIEFDEDFLNSLPY